MPFSVLTCWTKGSLGLKSENDVSFGMVASAAGARFDVGVETPGVVRAATTCPGTVDVVSVVAAEDGVAPPPPSSFGS